jgi:hypothetical protein
MSMGGFVSFRSIGTRPLSIVVSVTALLSIPLARIPLVSILSPVTFATFAVTFVRTIVLSIPIIVTRSIVGRTTIVIARGFDVFSRGAISLLVVGAVVVAWTIFVVVVSTGSFVSVAPSVSIVE